MSPLGSVYGLAMDGPGNLVIAGSPEKALKVWDLRMRSERPIQLIGHTDNTKAIRIRPDGTQCISGSSDGTIKCWDIGQQRCLMTYDFHEDAVWAITADAEFQVLYSGSRDGCIYRTDMRSAESVLVCREAAPVLRLALMEDERALWVATTSASARCWISELPTANRRVSKKRANSYTLSRSPAANLSASPSSEIGISEQPIAATGARPSVVHCQILNNRRIVLSRDSEDNVCLWDVVRGEKMREFGKVSNYEQFVTSLSEEPCWAPSWFSIDCRLGVNHHISAKEIPFN